MNIDFITADNANRRTKAYNDKEIAELLEKIQRDIIAATDVGKYKCIISSNKKIPKYILDFLTDKGYAVNYFKECISQRDGYIENDTKIEIHW